MKRQIRANEGELRFIPPGGYYPAFPSERGAFAEMIPGPRSGEHFVILENILKPNITFWKILSVRGICYVIADTVTVENSVPI